MSTALIASLALQACEDPDALPVLGDAVLEAEWFDTRVGLLFSPNAKGPKLYRMARVLATQPRERWALAVLAVCLFGEWPEKRFAVAERCQRPRPTLVDMSAALRRLYPQGRVENLAYETNSLFGLNRTPANRMAGMEIVTDAFAPRGRAYVSPSHIFMNPRDYAALREELDGDK